MYSDTKQNQKDMKECDKPNSHMGSKLHMIYIYLLIMIDTLLPRPSPVQIHRRRCQEYVKMDVNE
jgi:hypothetical protein